MTLDPQRQARYALEINKHKWRTSFYDRDRLQRDLLNAYLKDAPYILPKEYLAELIQIIGQIYADEFPPELPDSDQTRHLRKLDDPSGTYTLFLATFLSALIGITRAFPKDGQLPLQQKWRAFTRLLPVFTPDKQNLLPEIQTAFYALRKPLDDARRQFEDRGIFNWNNMVPYAWHEFDEPKPRFEDRDFYESEPIYAEPDERRRWHRDKREFDHEQKRRKQCFQDTEIHYWDLRKKSHEKAHKEIHGRILAWQLSFHGSPFHAYADVLIPDIHIPFELPFQKRFGGHYIVAPSGLGKTTLLTAMILEDIKRVFRDEASIIVQDPKGELTDIIKRLAPFARNDKLVLIEPEDNIAINPFDIDAGSIDHTVDAINYIFSSFAEQLTELQSTLLRPCIRGLLTAYPNPTLDTLQQLLAGGLRIERGNITGPFAEFAQNHPDPDLRSFFLTEFTNDHIYRDTKGQVLRRLRSLRENQIIKRWFTCRSTRFNIGNEINNHKVIVINNSRDLLTPNGAEFFGRFFIAQLRAAGERRKTNDPRNVPTFLYIDECDQVIKTDHNIEDYIDKLRSKNIGVILAHQRLQHFEGNKGTLDALLNAPIRFASADDDAEVLAKRLRVDDPANLRFSERGYFAAYIRQHKPETAVLYVNKPDISFMSEVEQADIRVKMRDRYSSEFCRPSANGHDAHTQGNSSSPGGDTLYWSVTISPRKAAKGGIHPVQILAHPSGTKKAVKVTIPAGTRDGARFRMQGAGVFRKDGSRGDLILTVKVPTMPTHTQVTLYGDIPDPDEIG